MHVCGGHATGAEESKTLQYLAAEERETRRRQRLRSGPATMIGVARGAGATCSTASRPTAIRCAAKPGIFSGVRQPRIVHARHQLPCERTGMGDVGATWRERRVRRACCWGACVRL